jgi:hypothetical protein
MNHDVAIRGVLIERRCAMKMKSPKTSESEPSYAWSALAAVRAEVSLALSQAVPNEARLTAALEQVEQLIADTREDLVMLLREMQSMVDGDSGGEDTVGLPVGGRGFIPW